VSDEPAFRPGIVVGGKFTLLRLIAAGGVGAVYEAEDALICRRVALKLLHPQYAKHPEIVRRFLREAQATASIDHPNVVTVFELGSARDGTFFIVQELLKGQNVRQRIADRGVLDVDEALPIVLPIADALAAAHRKGIVHRDVKPENIVLARTASQGIVPKLVDFGVAKMHAAPGVSTMTKIGVALGTVSYMSPEQARGDAVVDGRSDVWSLAAVLFEVLSGRLPYPGLTDQSILVQILTAAPPRLHVIASKVPRALSDTIKSALQREAEKRPTMQAFRERLLAFVVERGKPLPALSPGSVPASETEPSEGAGGPVKLEQIIELSEEDLDFVDERTTLRSFSTLPAGTTLPVSAPGAPGRDERPEMEWVSQPTSLQPESLRITSLAEQALRINALEDALRHAGEAARADSADDEATGRMKLMQAIASHWLGHYADAENNAAEAMKKLQEGTTGWYAALGHVVMAAGHQGRSERFRALTDKLCGLTVTVRPAHTVAACRLSVQLVRVGSLEDARKLFDEALDGESASHAPVEPFVRAWLAVAQGELSLHEGDPMKYMSLVKESVDDFVAAGDIRNASLQRSNIGNAYLQLGGYRQARRALSEALATAEPMKLSFAATARANLAFALARQGHLDEALAVETAALEECVRQGDRRFEAVARVYLATILTAKGDTKAAERSVEQAIITSENVPAVRAYALAILADLLLNQKHPEAGLRQAKAAMELLAKLDGVEEGESFIRLVYASALAQSGDMRGASRAMSDARARLMARADRISEARWRERFLHNIPENAQTLAFAKLWGDG
jgi:eukaryotic-like serine/threonine-protein kinase